MTNDLLKEINEQLDKTSEVVKKKFEKLARKNPEKWHQFFFDIVKPLVEKNNLTNEQKNTMLEKMPALTIRDEWWRQMKEKRKPSKRFLQVIEIKKEIKEVKKEQIEDKEKQTENKKEKIKYTGSSIIKEELSEGLNKIKKEADNLLERIELLLVEAVKPTKLTAPKKKIKARSVIETIEKIRPKYSNLPILSEVAVKDNYIYATDLEVAYVGKTDLADGMYKFFGKNIEKSETRLEDFPLIANTKDWIEIGIIDRINLIDMLSVANQYVSTDDLRTSLRGVLLEVKDKKGNIVGTNSRRIVIIPFEAKGLKDISVIVSNVKKVVIGLQGIEDNEVKIKVDKPKEATQISFEGVNEKIITKTIEGEYPDFRRVLSKNKEQIIVNKEKLIDAIETLKPYTKDKHFPSIAIEKEKDKLKLSVLVNGRKKEIEVNAEIIEKTYTPEEGILMMPIREEGTKENVIIINIDFPLTCLKHLEGETIYIGYSGEIAPLHFSDKDLS
jgi:DNA polymerase III sliding clamp (beta) subunit (PCNA family)